MNPEDPELAEFRRHAARISEWIVLALWTAVTALALLCWANRSSGAPAPFPKTKPARAWTPAGEWMIGWAGGSPVAATMTAAGGWTYSGGWSGVYGWDAGSRLLHVREQCGECVYEYLLRLDDDLTGVVIWGHARGNGVDQDLKGTRFEMRRK